MNVPTVACVFAKGHVPYTADYVVRLRSMVARHLRREHLFVCLTDQPAKLRGLDGVAVIEIPGVPSTVFAWWAKVHLFDRRIEQLVGRRCLYLDLDTVVLDSLDPIIDYPLPFALVPDAAPNFTGKGVRCVVKHYNSSVMAWDGGRFGHLYSDFSLAVTHRLWGDQDWIGEQCPPSSIVGEMPLRWFPRLSQCPEGPPAGARVLLCKKPKNEVAALRFPWFKEAWA